MNLFIDIETIPDQRVGAFDAILADIKPPANYKKPETIDKWMAEQGKAAAREKWLRTALDGAQGEVISIAYAFDDDDIVCIDRDLGSDVVTERVILETLLGKFVDEKKRGAIWTGHNVEWDIRFLWQRALILGVAWAGLIPVNRRDRVFCTMREWAGYRDTISLDKLCRAFGIKGKGGTTGADVWPMVEQGRYDELRQYNIDDVRKVRDIYRRMHPQTEARA